ncbi:MAG TPA: UDP-3-O-(3-hydroxymyristoyl)glucosamine N-acyltransferase [Tepidisphaeraceae bacterium]|jgi:UDP-3-O-[3-hydroxymyristoyl] glucosamine N-acyltransferase
MTLQELAGRINATVSGDGAVDVTSCATLDEARTGQISFLANPKYIKQLETTGATAVVVSPSVNLERAGLALLKAKDPYYAFTQAVVILHGYRRHPHQGVHPTAYVDPTASVGEGTTVYPGAFVGPRAKIGRDCILYPNAVVYDDCVLGDRVTLHAGAAVGVDGFGYATHQGAHHKIPQTGNVILEDDVEIGANCAIQRATLGSTVIGKGTKFGDLIDIGHGTRIGPHGLFVGLVGIAGSVVIGHHCTIAGQAGMAGHLKVGDNVTIGAQAGIMDSIPDQTTVIGAPAMPAAQARRVYSIFTQLPELVQRIKLLEQKVEELSAEEGSKE